MSNTYINHSTLPGPNITINRDQSLVVDGIDVGQFMRDVAARLHIIHENADLHETFPALKEAFDQYKTIESLLVTQHKGNTHE